MDEPFSALDKQTTNILRDELQNIWLKNEKDRLFYHSQCGGGSVLCRPDCGALGQSGEIKHIYQVNLPRPRKIDSPEFIKIRKEILELVQREVVKIAKEEYDQE